jgi:hypothetical protein
MTVMAAADLDPTISPWKWRREHKSKLFGLVESIEGSAWAMIAGLHTVESTEGGLGAPGCDVSSGVVRDGKTYLSLYRLSTIGNLQDRFRPKKSTTGSGPVPVDI